jgi:iron complex outermembrane receptor protein
MRRIIIILFFYFSTSHFAQTFEVSGRVIDEKNGEPLIGVNLILKELNIGTTTDANGNFTFQKIPNGNYTLICSFIGHKNIKQNVNVNQNLSLLIEMKEGSINLAEVIVTGNPFGSDPKEISQSTLSIANLDLQIKRGMNIGTTLNYQPGISMRSNGTAAARPVIRGFSNNRILILENGLRMGDLSNTSDDHGVSNDGSSAEKIEILRGPASLLYGNNALGGVVNIISEAIPSYLYSGLDGNINLSTSTVNNNVVGSADLHFGVSDFAMHTNFFRRTNSDYKDGNDNRVYNSDQKSNGLQVGLSYIPSFGLGGLSYSKFQMNYGIPYNTKDLNDDDEGPIEIEMKKSEFRSLFESNKINSFVNSFSLKTGSQNYNHKEILRNNGEIGTEFGMKTFSADLSFTHEPLFSENQGVFGFWGLIQNYTVTGEEAFTPNADYSSIAAYFFEQIKIDRINIKFGARFESSLIKIPESVLSDKFFESEEINYNSLSGSIGAVYDLSEIISFFTNIASAFRAPTIEELSSYAIHGATATFDIGNRQLKNEKNLGIDFGFRLRKDHHIVELSCYYNSINDFIFRNPTGIYYNPESSIPFNSTDGLPVFKYEQDDALMYGAELKAQYEINRFFAVTIVSDFAIGKKKNSNEYLPQMPPFRFSIEPRYSDDNLWFGLNWKLVADQSNVALNETTTRGYGIVDLYAGLKFITGNLIHIFNLQSENLLSQSYREHLSAIKDFALMPGRNIKLSYQFLF